MISVIIPLYNKEQQIGRTLRTVLNQTYNDIEVIVVNDGSTDNSLSEVIKYDDPRIRLINQSNAGVSAARNRGIYEAKGDLIAFIDADDEWDKEYLTTHIDLIERYPDASVYATNYRFCNSKGKEFSTLIRNLPFNSEDGLLTNYFRVASSSHPPLWTSAVIIRKNAFDFIGGFPVGIKSGEDLLTWARLAALYKIAYCRKPLAVFNVEGYDVSERPRRFPAEEDVVGRELVKIKEEFHPDYIDDYISHWHKMRSSIYMRLGQRWKCIREAIIGLKYNPTNYKLLAYCALNLLPRKLQPF